MHSVVMIVSRNVLFFDVDGTLLSEITHTVPESAVLALSETRKKGNLVFINSGRTLSLLGPIKEMVEADGYLCGCGTCVVAEGEVLYHRQIPHERGLEIRHNVVSYHCDAVLEAYDGCYFRKEPSRFAQIERIREGLSGSGCISPAGWDDETYEYDKLCVMADEKSDREGFFNSLKPDMEVIDRGNDFYECVPAGHSKATAIQLILEKYGIPLESAYVFGDSTNDLSMFEYAVNAVLMGHHDKELEPYATFTTKTVEEDGIAYAMKELGLI